MADVRVVGVDGVRDQWLAAVLDLDPTGARAARASWLVGSATHVLAPAGEPDVVGVGIDVPVGLVEHGTRHAEAEARTLLGRSASSVFATAPAAAFRVARLELMSAGALSRASRAGADVASRAAGGGGVSMQSWMIATKVIEVEDAVRALGEAGDRVVEVHPETTFTVMATDLGRPVFASKRSAPGVAQRAELLQRALPGFDVLAALAQVPVGAAVADRVPVDDALDSLAAACSALRHAYGSARVLGAGQAAVWSDGSAAPGRAVIVV